MPPNARLAALALLLLALVEMPVLLAPEVPPLDLGNHLGRAYILAHLRDSPGLRALYDIAWEPTPNLAADLLLTPLVALLGPRPAVRLFAGLSLLAMAVGFAAVCCVARGRWDPTALLGIPLAHNLHFNYGFINYYWGVAAALGSYAAWLRLREPRPLAVLALLLLSLATYLMHLVGFGTLVVAVGVSLVVDTVRAAVAAQGRARLRALLPQGLVLVLMALPPSLLYLGYSRGAVGGDRLHRVITWTPPRDKILGVLRVLRADRLHWDLPLFLLLGLLLVLGLRRARAEGFGGARLLVAGAGAALLLVCLAMPGALDLETANIDLRVALPALLLLTAALGELPRQPTALRVCLGLLVAGTAARGVAVARQWQRSSEGIAQSRALCHLLPAGARVTTLHNEVPLPGEVEFAAGERHGWAYCLFERPLFFPALFHVPGSQPLRLRLPAYEGTDTLAHYHVKNGFSNPARAREIPWLELLRLSDYLWLTNWDLALADPAGRARPCLEEVGRASRVVVYRVRREVPTCVGAFSRQT